MIRAKRPRPTDDDEDEVVARKDDKPKYAYRVARVLPSSRRTVVKHRMIKHDSSLITFMDGKRKVVEQKVALTHRWFSTFEKAQQFAIDDLQEMLRQNKNWRRELQTCLESIEAGDYSVNK